MSNLKPYTKEWLEELCAESYSLAEVTRKAGRKGGGAQETVKKKIEEFGIDISHFTGQSWSKGKTANDDPRLAALAKSQEKYSLEEVFCKNSPVTQHGLRGYIERYNIIPYKCDKCGCDGTWQDGKIALEVHHKDGNNTNNEVQNLTYLCPNCHALTDTFRRRKDSLKEENIKLPISEEEYCEALKTTPNIRQALIKLGLEPKGGNYTRAKALIEKYGIIQK